MEPPRTALGTLVVGLGVFAAGTVAGALIGSRFLPVGKNYGAIQGGVLGILITSAGASLVSVAEPAWAPALGITTFTGLACFTVAAVSSVTTVNKAFEGLGAYAPATAAAVDEAEQFPPWTTNFNPTPYIAPALATPASGTRNVITLDADNSGQTISANVGDVIILSLQVDNASTQWFYAEGATAAVFSYSGRSTNTTTGAAGGVSTTTDTWNVIGAGTSTINLQLLSIDSSGNAIAGTPQKTLSFTIQAT